MGSEAACRLPQRDALDKQQAIQAIVLAGQPGTCLLGGSLVEGGA
jgi:hypothetical protein